MFFPRYQMGEGELSDLRADIGKRLLPGEVSLPCQLFTVSYFTEHANYKSRPLLRVGKMKYSFEYLSMEEDDFSEKFHSLYPFLKNVSASACCLLAHIIFPLDSVCLTENVPSFANVKSDHWAIADFIHGGRFHAKNVIWDTFSELIYKVEYSYLTKRGNSREDFRYVVAATPEEAISKFNSWLLDFNNKYAFRSLSNVQILDSDWIGFVRFE